MPRVVINKAVAKSQVLSKNYSVAKTSWSQLMTRHLSSSWSERELVKPIGYNFLPLACWAFRRIRHWPVRNRSRCRTWVVPSCWQRDDQAGIHPFRVHLKRKLKGQLRKELQIRLEISGYTKLQATRQSKIRQKWRNLISKMVKLVIF